MKLFERLFLLYWFEYIKTTNTVFKPVEMCAIYFFTPTRKGEILYFQFAGLNMKQLQISCLPKRKVVL